MYVDTGGEKKWIWVCVCVYVCVCTSPSLLTMTSMSGCLLASFIWLVRGASDTFLFLSFDSIGVHLFFISEVFPVQQQHQGMKEDDEDMSLSGMQCGHLAFVMLTSMHTHTKPKKKAQNLLNSKLSFPTGTRTPVLRDFQEEFPVILRISYTNHLYYGEQ